MSISRVLTIGGVAVAMLTLAACHPAHFGHRGGGHGVYQGSGDYDARQARRERRAERRHRRRHEERVEDRVEDRINRRRDRRRDDDLSE